MTSTRKNLNSLRASLKQEDAAIAARLTDETPAEAAPSQSVAATGPVVDVVKAPAKRPAAKRATKPAKASAPKPAANPADPAESTPTKTAAKAGKAATQTPKTRTGTPKPPSSAPAAAATKAVDKAPAAAAALPPKAAKEAKPAKAEAKPAAKPAAKPTAKAPVKGPEPAPRKAKREKIVRDSLSMPENEHGQLKALRVALAVAGRLTSKSELLRAGLEYLSSLDTTALIGRIDALPPVPKGKRGKKH